MKRSAFYIWLPICIISLWSRPIRSQELGAIALDFDLTPGYQGQTALTSVPGVGDLVVIDVAARSGAQGQIGFQLTIKYDPTKLEWVSSRPVDLFATAANLPGSPPNGDAVINMSILGGTASADSGSLCQITFRILPGFEDEAVVALTSAQYGTTNLPNISSSLTIGAGATTLDPDLLRPVLVSAQTIESPSGLAVELKWEQTGDFDQFKIQRADSPSDFSKTIKTAHETLSFIDTDVTYDTEYIYRVTMIKGSSSSHPSNELRIKTPVKPLPNITLSHERVNFANVVPVGSTGTQNLVITNSGHADLSLQLQIPGISAFAVSPLSAVIAPEDSKTFEVRFAPSYSGEHQATVLVKSNDPDEPQLSVVLFGDAPPPPPPRLSRLLRKNSHFQSRK